MRKFVIFILILLIITAAITTIIEFMDKSSLETVLNFDNGWIDAAIRESNLPLNIMGASGTITIHAEAPQVPTSLLLYKGTLSDDNNIDLELGDLGSLKNSVTSEEDAPQIAEKIMTDYGGIPPDAVLKLINTSYTKKINGNTGEIVEKWPISTSVAYYRQLNGMPIVGDCDRIHVDIGENGEPLWIFKVWRTLEYTAIFCLECGKDEYAREQLVLFPNRFYQ